MRRYNPFLLLFTVFSFWNTYSQAPQTLLEFTKEEIFVYEPKLIEDFTSPKLNEEMWFGYYPWGGLSLDARTYTSPDMCKVKNGNVVLSLDTTSQWFTFPDWMIDTAKLRQHNIEMKQGKIQMQRLTSAIWSKEKFRFGYFECKCKMPEGQGYWPAFWLCSMPICNGPPNVHRSHQHRPSTCNPGQSHLEQLQQSLHRLRHFVSQMGPNRF